MIPRRWTHGHTGVLAFVAGGYVFAGYAWTLLFVTALIGAAVVVVGQLIRHGLRRTGELADAATRRLEAGAVAGPPDWLPGWAPCVQCGAPHHRRSPFCSSECRRHWRIAEAAELEDGEVPF